MSEFTFRSIANPSSTSLFDRKNSEPGIDNRFYLNPSDREREFSSYENSLVGASECSVRWRGLRCHLLCNATFSGGCTLVTAGNRVGRHYKLFRVVFCQNRLERQLMKGSSHRGMTTMATSFHSTLDLSSAFPAALTTYQSATPGTGISQAPKISTVSVA